MIRAIEYKKLRNLPDKNCTVCAAIIRHIKPTFYMTLHSYTVCVKTEYTLDGRTYSTDIIPKHCPGSIGVIIYCLASLLKDNPPGQFDLDELTDLQCRVVISSDNQIVAIGHPTLDYFIQLYDLTWGEEAIRLPFFVCYITSN